MPQIPNITLPKVAKYITNVGKSVKFAAIDYLGEETAPNIANFMETNEDLFKEIYSATKNYKDTISKAKTAFKQSRIYEAGEVGFKALLEDLKTGNFYNKEREEALGMKAMDLDMGDMDFDESAFSFDDDDTSDAARQTRAMDTSIQAASTINAKVTAATGEMVAGTIKDSTKMLWAQNEKLMANMTAGMGTIHSAIANVGKFMEGPMLTALQNTKVFQEETVKHQKKLEAQLDELLEMQRNLYKPPASALRKEAFGDIVDYDGIPDLREYGKQIFKNFKSWLGPEADMLLGDSFGKNANMLLTLVSSPLKFIPEFLVKTIVPATLKKTVEAFDKSLGGLFAQMNAKFGDILENAEDGPLKILAQLLHVKIEPKTGIATGKYQKGPVPFDGVTRQTIIEVIPGHLRRIEAALTGQIERIYDLERGKWGDIRTVEKEYKDRRQAAAEMAWWDARQPIDDYIRELRSGNKSYNVKIGSKNREEINNQQLANELEALLKNIINKSYEDGYFKGNRPNKDGIGGDDTAGNYYTTDVKDKNGDAMYISEAVYEELMKRIGNENVANRANLNKLANEIAKNKMSLSQHFTNAENLGYSTLLQLFNGAFDIKDLNGPYNPKAKRNNVKYANPLVNMVDENGKNIFFYLQGIYGTLLADSRNNGGRRVVSGNGKLPASAYRDHGSPITAEEALRQAIAATRTEDEETKEPQYVEVKDENGNTVSMDLSDNWYMAEQIKKMKEEEEKKRADGDTLFSALRGKITASQKLKAIKDVTADYLDKPAKLIDDLIKAADKRLYEVFYGKKEMLDVEKEEGHKFNGIIDRFMIRMEETFDKINDWLHEHLFKDIKTFMDENGITEKVDKAKQWIKDFIHLDDIKDSFREKFGIAKSSVTGAFTSVGNDIKNTSAYRHIMSGPEQKAAQNARYNELYEQLISVGYSPEDAAMLARDSMRREFNLPKYEYTRKDYNDEQKVEFDNLVDELVSQGWNKKDAEDAAKQSLNSKYGFAANGKFITKRGLVMVSPGETIIPAGGKRVQAYQLAREKAMAKRIGFKGGLFATGTSNALRDEDSPTGMAEGSNIINFPGTQASQADQEAARSTVSQVLSEMGTSKRVANTITSGLIGGGVSLITGLFGGPLLGAAVGAGMSIINQSETANKFFFGTEVTGTDGETRREGGLISDKFQKNFKKYFPDMKNYGIVGAAAGLFTPFGLVGGLMAGSAIGFLKNNESFQDYIWGPVNENGERDGGLIDKEFREKLNKAAPRMLVGAVGTVLLGPGPLLLKAVAGSALGYVTTTNKFHEFIFGVEQEDGSTKGGLVNSIKEGLVDPMINFGKEVLEGGKEFFKTKVIEPLKNFVNPVTQMIRNMFTNIGDKISDSFHDKVVTPVSDFVQHRILEPFGKTIMGILKIPLNIAKGVIAAPMAALQGIGNNIRGTQIAKGTATDMTAAQRVKWRNEHKGRSLFGRVTGNDQFSGIDQMLVSEFEGKEGLEQLRGMRDALNIYTKNSKKFGNHPAKLQQKLINDISNYLNNTHITNEDGSSGPSIYTHVGFKVVSRINKIIANAPEKGPEKINKILESPDFKGVTPDQRAQVMKLVNDQWPAIMKALENTNNDLKENQNFLDAVSLITRNKITNRGDLRKMMRNIDKEITTREAEKAWGVDDDAKLREQLADNRIKLLIDTSREQHNDLIDVLNVIAKALDGSFEGIPHRDENGNRTGNTKDGVKEGRPDNDKGNAARSDNFDQNSGDKIEKRRKAENYFANKYADYIEEGMDQEQAKQSAYNDMIKAYPDSDFDLSKYGNWAGRTGLKLRQLKRNIDGGINKARRSVFDTAGKAAGLVKRGVGGILDAAVGVPLSGIKGFMQGFNHASNEVSNEEIKNYNVFNESLEQGHAGLTSIGGVFRGPKEKVMSLFKKGYYMKDGVVYQNGEPADTESEGYKNYMAEKEEEEKYKNGLLTGIKDTAAGMTGLVGNLFGSGWKIIKNGAGWLTDTLGQVLDSTGIVGSIIKGIFGVGKLVLTASMIGHVVTFVKETLWEPIIVPFWEKYLWPGIKNIGSSVMDALEHAFPELAEGLKNFGKSALEFLGNPVDTAVKFIGDGLMKFWNNVAKPLGGLLKTGLFAFWDHIAAPLGSLIWNAIHNNKLDDFLAKSSTVNEVKGQKVNANGDKLYIDADGNETTDQFDKDGNENEAATISSNVQTKEYGKYNPINWITHGGKSLKYQRSTTHNGVKYELEEYYNGLVVVKNTATGDFMRFNLGSADIEFGARCDDNYKCSATSIVGLAVEGAIAGKIAFAAGTAYMAAKGATVGSVVPGVGTVIGAAVGLAAGIIIYTVKNNSGYTATAKFNMNTNPECVVMMAELGWFGDTSTTENWGVFNDDSSDGSYYKDTSSTPSPAKITSNIQAISQKIASTTKDSAYNIENFYNNINSGSSRSGKGHIYQHASDIANQRFGNSTIGEAGCGPVAATNLINKMGGNMDVGSAARYAESGGFIDRSTGGTTTDYLHSILNNSGIPTGETTNRADVYNSLRSGNPVMLLGNSGKERGTPFGAGDHYITAMGLDRSGNIIAEDPDLPNSYNKYRASNVLRDMDVGITTGMSRRKSLFGRRRKRSGRMHVAGTDVGGAVNPRSSNETKYKVPRWTQRASACVATVESGGDYAAVVCNDNGGMSVGKYQFHNVRAHNILNKIFSSLIANGTMTEEQIKNKVGSSLYNWVMVEGFSKRNLTQTEKENLKPILETEESVIAQEIQMSEDIEGYLYTIQQYEKSINVKDNEDIIIFWGMGHIHNVGNGLDIKNYDIPELKKNHSSSKDWSLDDVYNTYNNLRGKGTRGSKTRMEKVYNFLKSTKPEGDGIEELTGPELVNTIVESGGVYLHQIEAGSGEHNTSSGLLGLLGEAITTVMKGIYGDALMSIFGTSSSSTSSGGIFSNSYGDVGAGINIPTKATSAQNALVDRMKSKLGQIRYSLGSPQDPDQGQASCASTVGWAYNKVLGVKDMSAGAGYQAVDNRFENIYTKTEDNARVPLDILQPGDLIYQEWRHSGKFTRDVPGSSLRNSSAGVPMSHVQMYAGDGKALSHGGGSDGTLKGTNYVDMSDYQRLHTMMVRRYKPFLDGEKPDYWNLDGSKGTYPIDSVNTLGTTPLTNQLNKSAQDILAKNGLKMQYNFITGQMEPVIENQSNDSTTSNSIATNSIDFSKQASTYLTGGINTISNYSPADLLSGSGRSMSARGRNAIDPKKILKQSVKFSNGIYDKIDNKDKPDIVGSSDGIPGKNYKSAKGRARTEAVTYDDFLEVIISLLKVIAKNSDNLTQIVNILKSNYKVNITPSDITAGESRKQHLKNALRHSGLGRGGYQPHGTNGYGGVNEAEQGDIKYVVDLLHNMARA